MSGRTVVLALAGAVLAGVLGFAVHLIAGDTVGTPASRIESTVPLAPTQAADTPAPTTRAETTPTRTTATEPPLVTRTGENDGGRGRGRGRGRSGGDSGSGSGSDNSGPGSDD